MTRTRELFSRAMQNLQEGIPASIPTDPEGIDFVNASQYVAEEADERGIAIIHKLTVGDAEGTIEINENGITQVGGYLYADVQVDVPEGTIEITENGTYDVTEYAEATVDVAGLVPEGRLDIDENGLYDITEYAEVDVNVEGYPEPSGETIITSNGVKNVKDFATANVQVPSYPEPSGETIITSNGIKNVKDFATANVQVPTYPEPSGETIITSNGVKNVKDYATANVQVPSYPEPEGEKIIRSNGIKNIKDYATVNVQVPVPEVEDTKTVTQNGTVTPDEGYDALAEVVVNVPGPSGSQTFTENGTYDVSAIAQAIVNVSGGGDAPEIAWGEVTPVNQTSMTITLPWAVGSRDDVILVIIAKSDPRANYSTLTLENQVDNFCCRSYNGSLSSGSTSRSFDFAYNNNTVTITKNPSTGAYNLNATSYYWFALSPIENPTMFAMP